MRIACLCDAVSPYHHGGKETLQHQRSVRLAARGHAVRIHTMHWWPEAEHEVVRDGVALHAISPRVPLYTRRGRRAIWESVVMGLFSFSLLWSPEFDVLDVDQFPFTPFFAARLVCRLRRRPMTATWYEVWDRDYWRAYMGWLAPLGMFLQRFAARSADLVFADSRLTARRLTEWLDVDPTRVVVLTPGVDPISPSPLGGGSGSGSAQKTVDCIFVGRLLAHKHVDVMLRALAELAGVSGLVIGSGPEKDRLIALSQKLGLGERVRFEAPTDQAIVRRYLAAARLFVFPSTREGFGVAVLEANASAVPALVVQHPDNAAVELISDGVNGLVSSLDAQSMASQIRRYLADPQLQVNMSRAATASAARHTWDAYVERIDAALEALVETAPAQKRAA